MKHRFVFQLDDRVEVDPELHYMMRPFEGTIVDMRCACQEPDEHILYQSPGCHPTRNLVRVRRDDGPDVWVNASWLRLMETAK